MFALLDLFGNEVLLCCFEGLLFPIGLDVFLHHVLDELRGYLGESLTGQRNVSLLIVEPVHSNKVHDVSLAYLASPRLQKLSV